MANLALNKLPSESNWKNPEKATDGNFTQYDAHNGYAAAVYPCTFTIDLEDETKIEVVRILLWDGLGVGKVKNQRKYKFSISVSSDNKNYKTLFSNQSGEGDNGWFIFHLTSEVYARYVRFTGHYNSVNKNIHLVEFEIHDNYPEEIESNNKHSFLLTNPIPSEAKLKELISNVILEHSQVFEGASEKIKEVDNANARFRNVLEQVALIKESTDYLREAKKNNNLSMMWIIVATIIFGILLKLLHFFIYNDNTAREIIIFNSKHVHLINYIDFFLWSYYVTKALVISILIFIIGWILKIYRAEKHNYVVNKHKAMSLTVATGILTTGDYKDTDRNSIFNEAMKIVFSHQTTGYSKDDSSSPSIINTLLQSKPLNQE